MTVSTAGQSQDMRSSRIIYTPEPATTNHLPLPRHHHRARPPRRYLLYSPHTHAEQSIRRRENTGHGADESFEGDEESEDGGVDVEWGGEEVGEGGGGVVWIVKRLVTTTLQNSSMLYYTYPYTTVRTATLASVPKAGTHLLQKRSHHISRFETPPLAPCIA